MNNAFVWLDKEGKELPYKGIEISNPVGIDYGIVSILISYYERDENGHKNPKLHTKRGIVHKDFELTEKDGTITIKNNI